MRMTALAIAALFLPASIPAAEAASFDCAKATTQLEKTICGNPELNQADEIMGRAYATALGGLTEHGRAAVVAGQEDWLKTTFLGIGCAEEATKFIVAPTQSEQMCLLGKYFRRIGELGQSRMEGPWRVYLKISDSIGMDRSDGGRGVKNSSPRIDEDSQISNAFNALMEQSDASYKQEILEGNAKDRTKSTRIDSVGVNRISLRIDAYWSEVGAEHGRHTITFAHYLTEKGRMLRAGDLFTGKGWEEALGQIALDEFRWEEGDVEWKGDIPGEAVNPSRWNITEDGLEITFRPFGLKDYVKGRPPVRIDWDLLRPYLAAGYERLLY